METKTFNEFVHNLFSFFFRWTSQQSLSSENAKLYLVIHSCTIATGTFFTCNQLEREKKTRWKHIAFAWGKRAFAILKEGRDLQYWFANKQHKSFFISNKSSYISQQSYWTALNAKRLVVRYLPTSLLTLLLMYYYWQLYWYSSAWSQIEIQLYYTVCFV